MFLSLYDEVTNVLCVSLLSHDRYQYDSLTSQKNAWKKIFIFPIRYYTNCVSATLTVLILHNVESVYFFYSNLVLLTPVCSAGGPIQKHGCCVVVNFKMWFYSCVKDLQETSFSNEIKTCAPSV